MSDAPRKTIAVLGSTGSIGRQTLEVAAAFPDRFRVAALAAGSAVDRLEAQALQFQPACVALADERAAAELGRRLSGRDTRVLGGDAGVAAVAALDGVDVVVGAMVGMAGLAAVLAALEAGHDVALANKETLVAAGAVVTAAARRRGARLVPVDSEHSAIHQCLAGQCRPALRRIWLTASGGPFRTWPAGRIARATPADALRHPRWSMGPKVTVDSATLMNKGLEVIEAHWLFGASWDEVRVVVHPESIVHSLVEFRDGSFLAQLGAPDMRLPILYALSGPERPPVCWPTLDFSACRALTFEAVDGERFPCLGLAVEAGRRGGTAPAVVNAASEVAVAAFLAEEVPFAAIPVIISAVLEEHKLLGAPELAQILEADAWAREAARRGIGAGGGRGERPRPLQ